MNDAKTVEVFNREDNLSNVLTSYWLFQVDLFLQQLPKITSFHELQEEEVDRSLGKGEGRLDKMLSSDFLEDLMLGCQIVK